VPLVDRRTNSVVLRIVYDGPPEAGKATNLQQLCERLSLREPSVVDLSQDRAVYLDWLDATGEWIGGARVRCQLVNVPRQLQLARRGRNILDSADAVVFVADSRASAAPRTKAALRSLVRGLGNRSDVPLVLQANKQDLPGAQPPSDLHHALGLAARVPVIAAHAAGGTGVVETFTTAVRVAVDHVRARLVAGELGGDAINGNEPLLALDAIPEIFHELDAISSAADAAATQPLPVLAPPEPAPEPPAARPTPRHHLIAVPPELVHEATVVEPTPVPDVIVAAHEPVLEPPRRPTPPPHAFAHAFAHPFAMTPDTVVESISATSATSASDRIALGLTIDLAEWDRTPTETDVPPLPPAADADPTHEAAPVKATMCAAPASIAEAIAGVEIIELGTTASEVAAAGQPSFVPLGTPGPPDAPPYPLPTFDLPAGLVWPGVSGRSALAAIVPPVHVTTQAASWAPGAAIELACGERWLAHTAPALMFSDLDAARHALLDTIRWQARMAHLTPPGRTYAVSPQPDGARLWILTPVHRTVWTAIEEAFARGDRATAGKLARRGLEAVDDVRAHGAPIGDLDHIAIDEPPRLLTTPWTPRSDRLSAQLQRLFTEAVL
jgi:signal recognition particle receptor subunit beta